MIDFSHPPDDSQIRQIFIRAAMAYAYMTHKPYAPTVQIIRRDIIDAVPPDLPKALDEIEALPERATA